MGSLTIEMAALSDVGQRRSQNEDYIGYYEPADPDVLAQSGRLYIVADGVGGASAGEVASEYAARKVLYEYFQSAEPDLGKRLAEALRQANQDLFNFIEGNPDRGRMGTTMVAAAIYGDQFTIANIGDSRAYLIRDGAIKQITRDHSLVARMVEEGAITPEEAETHPKKNVIMRSLGQNAAASVDLFHGRLNLGDCLLLCSDGLTGHVADGELLASAVGENPDQAVKSLVALANERGGSDNISVLILSAGEAVQAKKAGKEAQPGAALEPPAFEAIFDRASGKIVPPMEEKDTGRSWVRWLVFVLILITIGVVLAFILL